ncbi:type II secretion system protein [Stutzerimonas xanthomarina]|uniref:Type II secretion system protein n=1 Tax=Stutzerimonas xanthomarina TaxID=271420 RepID=A0A427DMM0_9GAMM|nr:type II secretion system protein [Stutzerimonas xanthomarina]RRV04687.1 type II secretion system protein [Stutzerimonas xanthomarina]
MKTQQSRTRTLSCGSKQRGFTMVELGFVMVLIVGLAAVFLPDLFKQREDAKYSTAIAQIEKNFVSAIARQVARTNSCTAANVTKANLIKRGLPEQTVFGTDWSVAGVASNVVSITYGVDSTDSSAAGDIAAMLSKNANISSAVANGTTGVTIGYRCN